MVLLYSTRFRRRATTRPGLSEAKPEALSTPAIQLVTAAMSSFAGAGAGGGGILPVTSLSRTLSQTSGLFEAEASSENESRLRFAMFSLALWQPAQFFVRNGRMRESKVCRFCAAALCGDAK